MPRDLSLEKLMVRAVAHYDRGQYTRWECIDSLTGLVFRPGFFDCLGSLPGWAVDEPSKIASGAPAHPEDVINGNVHYAPMAQEEFDAQRRREREASYWCAKLLRIHFFPNQPLPPFEPILRVGTASESTIIDDTVVLFDEGESFLKHSLLIRNYPVRCIPPSGNLIITSIVRKDFVESPRDGLSGNPSAKRFDRLGLFLSANIRSPSEVPPGTEVWIDRSAAGEIPSLSDLGFPQ